MNTEKFSLLFLCTGNSARSILAEFLLKKIAPQKFDTYSAGASPKAVPHPMALQILRDHYQMDVSGARSKSWDEFRGKNFDFVITLCDNARETCPVWPGQPVIAHWPSPDPAEAGEGESEKVFWQVARQIQRRLELFASLPFGKLDALRLEAETRKIGQQEVIEAAKEELTK